MGMQCYVCGKKTIFGHNVSHSHKLTSRNFKPNLHRIRVKIGSKRQYIRVCTKCMRKIKRGEIAGIEIA